MNIRTLLAPILGVSLFATATLAPVNADAQTRQELQRRQQKKNEWRNIAIGAGAVAVYGLIKGDKTLTIAGAAGAAYAGHRYEQDRKSQRRLQDQRRYGYSGNRYDYNRYGSDRYGYGSDYSYGRSYSYSGKKNKKNKNVPKGKAHGYWKKR